MAARLVQINMKARDDSALGGFWAEALGWGVSSEEPGVTNLEPEGFVYPDPIAVCLDLVVSPEPKTVKNRVHVDLATNSTAHQAEVVTRLKDLGATPVDVGQGDVPWTVMADPEGNEFCVLDPDSRRHRHRPGPERRPVDGPRRPGRQRVLPPHPRLTRTLVSRSPWPPAGTLRRALAADRSPS
ncbi:VOC family protein [Micromonospora sp. CPCC 205556]|uniref:VOC family protein n=1 Tax=Micromonospora sp. CPCC 205556 TaxID=3122398 RepID=UPI003FA58BC1